MSEMQLSGLRDRAEEVAALGLVGRLFHDNNCTEAQFVMTS
jgi:hypothetical protein